MANVAHVKRGVRWLVLVVVTVLVAPPLTAHASPESDRQAEIQAEIEQLRGELDEVAADEAEALADLRVTQRRKAEVEARAAELQTARDAQASATATADAEAAHEESLLASLRGQRSAYERRIRDQQRESDEIADLLRRRGSGGATISGHGSLSSPVATPVITSTYGYRVHPIFGDRRLHTGIDLRASSGTAIKAAAPGEVVFAGWRGGYGNCTIVDHGGGVATLYAHQSALQVAQGDEVKRGQVIGAAGATGNATGPHLHFEVRVNGVPVDPMPYL